MEINYKTIIEFFRLAIVTCLMEKEELIKWADEEILQRKEVNNDIIELSLSGKLPYSQLIGLLNTFRGIADHQLAIKLFFAYALSRYAAKEFQMQALISGFQMLKAEAHVGKEIVRILTALENELAGNQNSELANQELNQKLVIFLNQFAEYQEMVNSILTHKVDLS